MAILARSTTIVVTHPDLSAYPLNPISPKKPVPLACLCYLLSLSVLPFKTKQKAVLQVVARIPNLFMSIMCQCMLSESEIAASFWPSAHLICGNDVNGGGGKFVISWANKGPNRWTGSISRDPGALARHYHEFVRPSVRSPVRPIRPSMTHNKLRLGDCLNAGLEALSKQKEVLSLSLLCCPQRYLGAVQCMGIEQTCQSNHKNQRKKNQISQYTEAVSLSLSTSLPDHQILHGGPCLFWKWQLLTWLTDRYLISLKVIIAHLRDRSIFKTYS